MVGEYIGGLQALVGGWSMLPQPVTQAPTADIEWSRYRLRDLRSRYLSGDAPPLVKWQPITKRRNRLAFQRLNLIERGRSEP